MDNLEHQLTSEEEGQLTGTERYHLHAARSQQFEVHALGDYSCVLGSLRDRLGEGSGLARSVAGEYLETTFQGVRIGPDGRRDEAEDRKIQMMRTHFIFPNTDMDPEVIAVLKAFDIFGGAEGLDQLTSEQHVELSYPLSPQNEQYEGASEHDSSPNTGRPTITIVLPPDYLGDALFEW